MTIGYALLKLLLVDKALVSINCLPVQYVNWFKILNIYFCLCENHSEPSRLSQGGMFTFYRGRFQYRETCQYFYFIFCRFSLYWVPIFLGKFCYSIQYYHIYKLDRQCLLRKLGLFISTSFPWLGFRSGKIITNNW